MLALEIHLQRQTGKRPACFQLCFYSIPGDAAVIGEKVRVSVAPVIVQVDGEEPIPVAGEAIRARMVEMLVPAVVAKAEQIGYMMIIYIAGLQSIPNDYLEAAYIDGANSWQTLWKVKIPNVMPSITICLFLTLTNSFKLFDQNLALTGGEPAHMTEMLALNIYNTFYARSGAQWKGYGQAKAVIFCVLVIVISMIQLRATRAKEVQQ